MKVKIFYEYDEPTNRYGFCEAPLEKRINDFIKDKKVIDIKYQANNGNDLIERALVMYKEHENDRR